MINGRHLLCLAAAFQACCAVGVSAQQLPVNHPFPNYEKRVLPVTDQGRHYQIYVGLPDSYGREPTRRYPVVYVTDGYWEFPKMTSIQGALAYDRVVPEFITVGLSYAGPNPDFADLRRWELSPAPVGDTGEKSGHASDFLANLKTRIIPLVDSEYRTDPSYRVLAGTSLGGLFTLYTMLSSPGLFQGYIAATPAVMVDNDWLFRYEDRLVQSGAKPRGRLYMTVGGNESPAHINGILRFNQRLASRQTPGFDYHFQMVEGERHGGAPIESYTRGLRFVFLPRAPESGPVL